MGEKNLYCLLVSTGTYCDSSKFDLPSLGHERWMVKAVLQIRRGNKDNLEIIGHIFS